MVLDPPNPASQVAWANLDAQWDGNGLIISSRPIDLAQLSSRRRTALLPQLGAALGFIGALRIARVSYPKNRATAPFFWCRASVAASIILFGAALGALVFHSISTMGYLRNPSATGAVKQAHLTDLLPTTSSKELHAQNVPKLILVDARYPRDFSLGHINGAINVPYNVSDAECDKLFAGTPKHQRIVIYCQSASCPFSNVLAARLYRRGFVNLSIYRGGWNEWNSVPNS